MKRIINPGVNMENTNEYIEREKERIRIDKQREAWLLLVFFLASLIFLVAWIRFFM